MALMSFHVGSVTKNLLFLCVEKAQKHDMAITYSENDSAITTKAEDQVNSEWTSKK